MSGIYIPGARLPEGCYDNCPCQALHWCQALNADTTETLMKNRRLDGCPLVPVPDHGRLVDADAFERRCMFDSNVEDMQDVIYALRDYTTIIPGEEGSNNGGSD